MAGSYHPSKYPVVPFRTNGVAFPRLRLNTLQILQVARSATRHAMFPSLLTTAVLTVAVCLVSASDVERIRVHDDHLDPQCVKGLFPGFLPNTFQFDTPAEKFYAEIGSFFRSEWYGPINATHGKDNTIGATRDVSFGGVIFKDKLVEYSRTSTKLVFRYVLDNGPVTIPPEQGNLTLSSYTEELEVLSICGASGTYFSIVAVYCTDKAATAFTLFDQFRKGVVGALAEKVGARVFGGICPNIG